MVPFLDSLIGILWGPWTFFVLMGAGIIFTLVTKFGQWVALSHGIMVLLGKYDDDEDPGAISHFQALSAALSGTVGLGNIGGVALAIGIGGPGALFWMWVTGFLGMAIKMVEVTLALMYRNEEDRRHPMGGAMWVARKVTDDLGGNWKPIGTALASFFCFTLLVSTITGGNIFQAWNLAEVLQASFGVPQLVTSVTMAVVVGMVIIGGISRIGQVAGLLVPFMVAAYVVACFAVLIKFYDQVPGCISLVVSSALSPNEAGGAFLGAGAYFGFTQGLKRALFSSEAGQGSAPIAHAAARTDKPAREGVVGGLEPFIDTLVICSLTALVILVTGTWNRDALGELPPRVEIQAEGEPGEVGVTLAPTVSVAELPAPYGGHEWRAGDTLFVVLEHDGAVDNDTANTRMRLRGVIERGTDENERPNDRLTVKWDTVSLPDDATEATFVSRGVYRDLDGAPLTGYAFDRAFPGLGKWLVSLASLLFAISTMISWSYYGEMATLYLFGPKMTVVYKMIFLVFIAIAPLAAYNSSVLLTIIDLGTGLMLWANLPILFLFGGRAVMNLNGYVSDWRNDRFVRGRKPPADG